MRRHPLLPVLLALFLALSPLALIEAQVAHAETVVYDPGPPKGVVGADGIRCIGTATAGGHTYTSVQYVGADEGEMSSDPGRERNWQAAHCRWLHTQPDFSVIGWFKYQHGIMITPDDVKITIEHL